MIIYANGRVIGTDDSDDPQNIGVMGATQDILKVGDLEQQGLLTSIIKELKIMNIHLSMVTDNIIERADVEV